MSRTARTYRYNGLTVEITSDAMSFTVYDADGRAVGTIRRPSTFDRAAGCAFAWFACTTNVPFGLVVDLGGRISPLACLQAIYSVVEVGVVPLARDLGVQHDAHCASWVAVRYLAGAIADIARDYAYDLQAIDTLDTHMERMEAHERARQRRFERSTRLAVDCITLDIRHQPRD